MPSDPDVRTILLFVLAALLVLPLLTTGMGGPMMHDGGTWGGGGATAAPGWVLLASLLSRLLVVAAVVGVGYLLYRAVAGNADERDDALAELRRAYACGDLSDEEFERRRERLRREE